MNVSKKYILVHCGPINFELISAENYFDFNVLFKNFQLCKIHVLRCCLCCNKISTILTKQSIFELCKIIFYLVMRMPFM